MRLMLFILFVANISLMGAQDSLRTFSFNEYIEIVTENHPMAYQASLITNRSEYQRMQARGGFDPKVSADYASKDYDKKNYYQMLDTKLKIPTWFGAEIYGSYERSEGVFLNNQETLPPQGIWAAGIQVPLGKNLLIDERRTNLKLAKIYANANEQERISLENELLFNAANAYLDWQAANYLLTIANEGVLLAETRFQITKESFQQGDKPAIDTLEAFISFQNRLNDQNQAIIEVNNARIFLNTFLWKDGFIPLEIQSNIEPEALNEVYLNEELLPFINRQNNINTHPEILLATAKIEALEVKNRLNREQLKPELNVKFQPLVGSTQNQLFAPYNPSDYKLGASFYYPIFLRKERAKIQLTNIEIGQQEAGLEMKRQNILAKLQSFDIELQQIQTQLDILENNIENYNQLLDAENRKFAIGESSIFLINSREIKYLESRRKRIEYQAKLIGTRFKYLYVFNKLPEVL